MESEAVLCEVQSPTGHLVAYCGAPALRLAVIGRRAAVIASSVEEEEEEEEELLGPGGKTRSIFIPRLPEQCNRFTSRPSYNTHGAHKNSLLSFILKRTLLYSSNKTLN